MFRMALSQGMCHDSVYASSYGGLVAEVARGRVVSERGLARKIVVFIKSGTARLLGPRL